jgi:hypothetical protein
MVNYGGGTDKILVFPTGDTSGAADTAALKAAVVALGSQSSTIGLGSGSWYLIPGQVVIKPGNAQTIVIDGQWGAVINAVGGTAGDVLRMYNPAAQTGGASGNIFSKRSGVRGVIIDGANAAAGSAGLHLGDLMNAQLDVIIQNFSGAGSIGLHLDNSVSWTEQADMRAALINNTSNVVFEVTTGYQSFAYGNFDFTIQAQANQDGVVLKNGAYLYSGKGLTIRGNFLSSASAVSNAVLRLTGACPVGTPDAGQYAAIYACHLDILAESNGGQAHTAQTIFLDASTSVINAFGILNFGATNLFVPCNITPSTDSSHGFQFANFTGFIEGDPHLNPAGANGSPWTATGPVMYTQSPAGFFGATGFPSFALGDFFQGTLTANLTVTFNNDVQAGPQRKTFIITQAAASGPYTVTWPHNGAPTLNSPTVKWAGGAAPVMSAGAGAVDVYDLETIDGVTWYGRATQNVS